MTPGSTFFTICGKTTMGLLAVWMSVSLGVRAANPLLTPIARAGTAWPVTIAAMTQDAAGYTYVTGARLVEGISSGNPGVAKALTYVFVAHFDPSGAPVYVISFGWKASDARPFVPRLVVLLHPRWALRPSVDEQAIQA